MARRPKKVRDESVTPEDVAYAKESAAEAKQAAEEAKAQADELEAQAKELEKATEEVPDHDVHIYVDDGNGNLSLHERPHGFEVRSPRITFRGHNFEHVAEGENDVWVYRRM